MLFIRAVYSSCGTSNMTGHHWGPKQKLRADYRALSRHRHALCRHSYFCPLDVRASSSFPRLPFCQISFLSQLPLLSQPVKKYHALNHSINHSLKQLIWCAWNQSIRFGIALSFTENEHVQEFSAFTRPSWKLRSWFKLSESLLQAQIRTSTEDVRAMTELTCSVMSAK